MTIIFPENLLIGSADEVTIRLHLQPRASKNEICGIQGEELKVRVTSPPVDDAANKLCIEFFAKLFKLPKSAVRVISGQKSRHKKLKISGIARVDATDILVNALLNLTGALTKP